MLPLQVETDGYLRELHYLKLHATELPWVKAEDDVADAHGCVSMI